MNGSVRLSVRHTFLTMFPSSDHQKNFFQKLLPMTEVMSMQKVKVIGQRVKVTEVITPLSRFRTVTPV